MYYIYNCIPVHTSTYQYIPVCTKTPDFVPLVGIPDEGSQTSCAGCTCDLLWGMVGVELPARNLSVQLVKTSMSLDCFAIMMYNACTLHVHVHTVYIHVHTLYMGTTYCIHIPLWYIPLCTALVIGMYYAIVQELVILCIEGSDTDRPSRNG